MYGLVEHEDLRQTKEEIPREVAEERLAKMADEHREPGPYVVRDLSWELARYLDTQSLPASASAPSNSTSSGGTGGNERRRG